jgi:hypothetical protein
MKWCGQGDITGNRVTVMGFQEQTSLHSETAVMATDSTQSTDTYVRPYLGRVAPYVWESSWKCVPLRQVPAV